MLPDECGNHVARWWVLEMLLTLLRQKCATVGLKEYIQLIAIFYAQHCRSRYSIQVFFDPIFLQLLK